MPDLELKFSSSALAGSQRELSNKLVFRERGERVAAALASIEKNYPDFSRLCAALAAQFEKAAGARGENATACSSIDNLEVESVSSALQDAVHRKKFALQGFLHAACDALLAFAKGGAHCEHALRYASALVCGAEAVQKVVDIELHPYNFTAQAIALRSFKALVDWSVLTNIHQIDKSTRKAFGVPINGFIARLNAELGSFDRVPLVESLRSDLEQLRRRYWSPESAPLAELGFGKSAHLAGLVRASRKLWILTEECRDWSAPKQCSVKD